MDFVQRMAEAIDYVEAHITDDIDYQDVVRIVCCGVYQFGRIFSYLVGMSLNEYVRRRRLSLAALALAEGGHKVVDVALAFGYAAPESFARAFRALHGISPREACAPGVMLKLCPRLAFHISIKGEQDMEYRIEQKDIIRGVGLVKNLGKCTVNQQAEHWTEKNASVWQLWDAYLNHAPNRIVRDHYRLYRPPFWQMGVTHTLDNGETVLAIGAEDAGGDYPELTRFEVPASTWAVFPARGTLDRKEHPVEALMTRIYAEWLPSSGYEQSMPYEIEVYGPGDTGRDDYTTEVWIPIRKIRTA